MSVSLSLRHSVFLSLWLFFSLSLSLFLLGILSGVTMIEEGELHAVKASMGNFLKLTPNYKVLLSDSQEKFADEV